MPSVLPLSLLLKKAPKMESYFTHDLLLSLNNISWAFSRVITYTSKGFFLMATTFYKFRYTRILLMHLFNNFFEGLLCSSAGKTALRSQIRIHVLGELIF